MVIQNKYVRILYLFQIKVHDKTTEFLTAENLTPRLSRTSCGIKIN